MNFEEQENLILQHTFEHLNKQVKSVDHSCQICYPPSLTIPFIFDNFWKFVRKNYIALSYTSYTVLVFEKYCEAHLHKQPKDLVDKFAQKLLFSIRFDKNPTSVLKFINNLSNLATQTTYFQKSIKITTKIAINKDQL